MRIAALLPLSFDLRDFFARFFATPERAAFEETDDLRIAV